MKDNTKLENLIVTGTLDTSTNPFVLAVKEALPHVNERIYELSGGRIPDYSSTRSTQGLLLDLNPANPRGIGYSTSSLHHDANREALWTAIITKCFLEYDFHPLIVSVDQLKTFNPYSQSNPSFADLPKIFSNYKLKDEQGKPYVLIVSDFSNSIVYTEQTLEKVPHQKNAGLDNLAPYEVGFKLSSFANNIYRLFESNCTLNEALERISGLMGSQDRTEDIRLLLCTSLLLQDQQNWQGLWYESKKEGGVPLYFVAPTSFHRAMNRLNFCWGHGSRDYRYRASNSLGAYHFPAFDIVDGKVFLESEFKMREYEECQGVSVEVFTATVGDILDKALNYWKHQ